MLIKTFTARRRTSAPTGRSATGRHAQLKIESVRVTAKGVVARLKGVADRNAAEALKGTELYVAREKLPQRPTASSITQT